MKDEYLRQASAHVQQFFTDARLHKKKWYREIKHADVWLYAFFVIRRRMLQPKHYTVHESSHLVAAHIKPEALRDYQALKTAWTQKGDLKKFHTENSKILYPIDGLLEDWGINHLHLDRARQQIFFRTEGLDIYVIHIVTHFGRGHMGYSKGNLLRILEESWPGRFSASTLKNIRPDLASSQYPSRYGWHQVEAFHRWLEECLALPAEGPLNLIWVDNEAFQLLDKTGTMLGVPFWA